MRTGDLTFYDLGPDANLQVYGVEVPPEIPIADISTPLAIMFAEFDNVITPPDADWFRTRVEGVTVYDQIYAG